MKENYLYDELINTTSLKTLTAICLLFHSLVALALMTFYYFFNIELYRDSLTVENLLTHLILPLCYIAITTIYTIALWYEKRLQIRFASFFYHGEGEGVYKVFETPINLLFSFMMGNCIFFYILVRTGNIEQFYSYNDFYIFAYVTMIVIINNLYSSLIPRALKLYLYIFEYRRFPFLEDLAKIIRNVNTNEAPVNLFILKLSKSELQEGKKLKLSPDEVDELLDEIYGRGEGIISLFTIRKRDARLGACLNLDSREHYKKYFHELEESINRDILEPGSSYSYRISYRSIKVNTNASSKKLKLALLKR